MSLNSKRKTLCRHLLVGGALCAAGFGLYSCSDTYDLDTEQPDGLNSLYGYMIDRPDYSTFMQLIDDLGETEIMSKTGSRTLFIANNDAFAKFFAKNSWGVSSYGELTRTQKKLLFNASMIDNPLTTSMLSTAQGPVKGEVCRRISGQQLLDTVSVLQPNDPSIPNTPYWEPLREAGQPFVLFRDASGAPPMVHFTAKFMSTNRIESSDLDFLYNRMDNPRHPDDAHVGNATVTNPNQFCLNGFVHEVDKVLTPLDNMAEVIRINGHSNLYSSILERYSAPALANEYKETYNATYGTNYDNVYVKRYASKRSAGSSNSEAMSFSEGLEGMKFDNNALLKFDPGWNTYLTSTHNSRDALMEDMAVMLVPTDEALKTWWIEGKGSMIREYYKSLPNNQGLDDMQVLDSVPLSVFAQLINNGMLENITTSVPSKFAASVKDDAQMPMQYEGEPLSVAHIDSVIIGCNGAIYLTNKVFAPTSFRSVLYPAVIKQDVLSIINSAVNYLDYFAYLNVMLEEIKYSFFVPTNNGFITYVDPVSFGETESTMWEFYFDAEADANKQVKARKYKCTYDAATNTWLKGEADGVEEGAWRNSSGVIDYSNPLVNRMVDILDNIIALSEVKVGQQYYKTKGNNYIRLADANGNAITALPNEDDPASYQNLKVWGSLQDEQGLEAGMNIVEMFDMENGSTYILDGVICGTNKAVADVLSEPEHQVMCNDFYEMLSKCAVNKQAGSSTTTWTSASQLGNLVSVISPKEYGNEDGKYNKYSYLLNAFHYTIYAPSNDAMLMAYEWGLPTLDSLDRAETADAENAQWNLDNEDLINDKESGVEAKPIHSAAQVRMVWLDFIKYHIHDNSVYVDNGFKAGEYESGVIELNPKYKTDPETGLVVTDEHGNPVQATETKTGDPLFISGRPHVLVVNPSATGITVTDVMGKTANVLTSDKNYYNIQAREYWINSSNIESTANAVIHVIDRPLVYDVPFIGGSDEVDKGKPSQFKYVRKAIATGEAKLRK